MTDTNQASELYELCKKVYELTGWKGTQTFAVQSDDDTPFTVSNEHTELGHKIYRVAYLYTSDYLLEKLQQLANTDRNQLHLFTDTNNGYSAKMTISGGSYGEEDYHWYEISDGYGHRTPVLALLKLTIALSEAGELK